MITIVSDICQQLVYRAFIKIYPKQNNFKKIFLYKPFHFISPKKTLIGYLGGLITLSIHFFFDYNIKLIFMLYISGCFGDLFASYFKRVKNIKDYSNYLGSHGGFLDRFDAVIMNIHFFYVYTLFH
jgi:phosphatidate cytidylyltransferase